MQLHEFIAAIEESMALRGLKRKKILLGEGDEFHLEFEPFLSMVKMGPLLSIQYLFGFVEQKISKLDIESVERTVDSILNLRSTEYKIQAESRFMHNFSQHDLNVQGLFRIFDDVEKDNWKFADILKHMFYGTAEVEQFLARNFVSHPIINSSGITGYEGTSQYLVGKGDSVTHEFSIYSALVNRQIPCVAMIEFLAKDYSYRVSQLIKKYDHGIYSLPSEQ